MKQGALLLFCLAGSLAMAACARSAPAAAPMTPAERQVTVMDNPYNAIVERNIFDLHDPPPPPAPKPTNEPPPNIHLTGITTILGKKQAYFMLQSRPLPGKPAAPDRYMTLVEGERREMLEVLEINPKMKTVKISNEGTVSTITFETNKIAFTGTPGAAAGGATHLGGFAPGAAQPNYYPNNPNGPTAIPPRPMRPTSGGNSYGAAGVQSGGPQVQYGGYQPNSGTSLAQAYNNGYNYNPIFQNPGAQNAAAPAQAAPPMDPEQQIVLMELQREATKQAVASGQLPPLPPTPLSDMVQQQQQQQSQPGGPPAPTLPVFPGQHNSIH